MEPSSRGIFERRVGEVYNLNMKLTQFLLSVVAILISAYIIPGVTVTILGAVIAAVILGVLNLFLKPVLHIISLPVTILTLGLFSLVINAFIVWIAAKMVPGFQVEGFFAALIFSILLSLISTLFGVRR